VVKTLPTLTGLYGPARKRSRVAGVESASVHSALPCLVAWAEPPMFVHPPKCLRARLVLVLHDRRSLLNVDDEPAVDVSARV